MNFYKISETFRMGLIAIAGTAIGWATYELLYLMNPLTEFRATSTWLVEFAIGVLRQHALHRYLTFRAKTPYWKTLARAYVFYILCAIMGAAFNYVLTEMAGCNYRLAWFLCALLVALMSFLFLKKRVFLMSDNTTSATVPIDGTQRRREADDE
jgi:putative flippase GtrA